MGCMKTIDANRKQVIAVLELYRTGIESCLTDQLIDDVIALLKEQEVVGGDSNA